MKREATLLLTTTLVLAGCIATPENLDAASAEVDSPLLDELGATTSEYTSAGEAIVLRTNATPEGGMASFWWEIPEGALLKDDDDTWVEFLAAPVLLEKDRAQLERWIVMGFLADEGMLALNTMAFGAPLEIQGNGFMGGGSETIERTIEPFVFGAGGKLREGGRIGFVVGGVASTDVEMALVLLPLSESWDDDEDVPDDTDAFLSYLSATPLVALPPEGEGGMHQVAFYFEGTSFMGGLTVASGPVTHEGETTDLVVASRRAGTTSTGFESAGYTIAAAGFDAGSMVGDWAATANAHGAISEGSGTIVSTFGINVDSAPYVIAIGEGEEASATVLTLQTTSANAFGENLYVIEVDLDRTLTDLLGLPALKIEGLTGNGGFAREGEGLGFNLGGARILLPNVL